MTVLTCAITGKSITLLGEEIANSGEAKIWRTNQKGYLAKIYHSPTPERVQKLAVMIAHPPTEPNSHLHHVSFAWPKSALKNAQGDCVGFLMPEIKDGKELIDVYNPQRRKQLKLEIDWRFLHTTALNIVSIIEALHAAGYVLGDIKPQNILVNNRALPSIIDTDSFQVKNPKNGKVYYCLVGSEGYTPPELIEKDFDRIEQTEVHDRFRLGVIIYQLLFGGNNPFQGKWTGAGEIPDINELICQGLWVNGSTNLIAAVARTIPLEIVHPEVQQCFLKCFNDGHKNPNFRPTARKWLEALKVGNDRLTICGRVDNHYYSRTYGKCYWCDRSTNLGVDIFPGVVKANSSVVVESASQPQVISNRFIGNLLQTLTGHSYSVISVAYSPDGQTLASGSYDNTIKLWDVKTGNLLQTLTGHSDYVNSVAYSPDGQTLASGSFDDTIKLWDVKTGNLLQTLTGDSSSVNSVAYSPDGQTLASGSHDNSIKLWNVKTGNLLQTLSGHSDCVWSVAYSPDGQTLASGSHDKTIKLWDVKTGNLLQTLTGHSYSVSSVAYSPDGQTLASGSSDKTIKLWDVKTGNLLQTFTGHSSWVYLVAYSPDGQTLASGSSDKTIKLWDVKTGNLLQTFTGHSELVNSVAYSPDGQTLASGSTDRTIKIWQLVASISKAPVQQTQSQVSQTPVSTPQSQPVITQVTATSTTNTSSSIQQPQSQVSQPPVSIPQSQPVITQVTATSTTNTSSLVQQNQSQVSQTNQSANLPNSSRRRFLRTVALGLIVSSVTVVVVGHKYIWDNGHKYTWDKLNPADCIRCQIKYPDKARKRGVEGTAEVAIDTDSQGNVTQVRLVSSSGDSELDEAAQQAAQEWKLTPTVIGRKGVRASVNFAMKGSQRHRQLQERQIEKQK
ncbi:MAG: TonB family protein [Dolichospermum sp. BR01]|nr:TonB family protein [Dolichospermum sp. BR01]